MCTRLHDVRGQRDGAQQRAAEEGVIADAREPAGQRDGAQRRAAVEGANAEAREAGG